MIVTQDTAVAVMRLYTPYFKFHIKPQGEGKPDERYYLLEAESNSISSLRDLVPAMVFQYSSTTMGRESIYELAARAQLIERLEKINKQNTRYEYMARDIQIKPKGVLFELYRIKRGHVRKVPTNHLDKKW